MYTDNFFKILRKKVFLQIKSSSSYLLLGKLWGRILHKVAKFGEGIIIHCIYESAFTSGQKVANTERDNMVLHRVKKH